MSAHGVDVATCDVGKGWHRREGAPEMTSDEERVLCVRRPLAGGLAQR